MRALESSGGSNLDVPYAAIRERLRGAPGRAHLIGIGGVGMAGVARLLQARGWQVDGCDAGDGALMAWLRGAGIPAVVGHDPAHLIGRPDMVVRTPAVHRDNPEIAAARAAGIPVIERGRLLPLLLDRHTVIAVAGTHGKTTTASMLAWCVRAAGRPCSFCIGGIAPGLDAVAHAEADGIMVIEADESDGTLRDYVVDTAVITTTDLDHVDHFDHPDKLAATYRTFAAAARRLIYPVGEARADWYPVEHTGAWSFGLDEAGAMVRAEEVVLAATDSTFTVCEADGGRHPVRLGVPGRHNVANALAAWAALRSHGMEPRDLAAALARFRLPQRRFEQRMTGRGILVISDYAHHPVEIASLLAQTRLARPQRMIGVFQPHRYSRTRYFRDAFAAVLGEMDRVALVPVYAASEPSIAGGTTEDLYRACLARGDGGRVVQRESLEAAWTWLQGEVRRGDVVLIIGAGDVEQVVGWAEQAWAKTELKS
jgi:UDP-N-acetylmuramate--alanine ligase